LEVARSQSTVFESGKLGPQLECLQRHVLGAQ